MSTYNEYSKGFQQMFKDFYCKVAYKNEQVPKIILGNLKNDTASFKKSGVHEIYCVLSNE